MRSVDGSEMSAGRFAEWLCQREHEVVGTPGTWFSSPLALWLSELHGCVCGVWEGRYGRASVDPWRWDWLPGWARLYLLSMERRAFCELRGWEAFDLLAQVEGWCGGGLPW